MSLVTRKKYVKPKEIAEIYSINEKLVYRYLQMPVFRDARKQVGSRGVRVDADKFEEILNQYFNS